MRKNFTMPKYMDDLLREIAAKYETSQSAVIQQALTMLFLMDKHAPKQVSSLSKMIPDGQTEIYDFLRTEK